MSVVVVPCAPLSVDDSGGKMVVVSCAPLSVEELVVIKVVVSCLTLVEDICVVVCGLSVLLMRLVLVLTFSVVSGTTDVISNVVTIVWLLVVE